MRKFEVYFRIINVETINQIIKGPLTCVQVAVMCVINSVLKCYNVHNSIIIPQNKQTAMHVHPFGHLTQHLKVFLTFFFLYKRTMKPSMGPSDKYDKLFLTLEYYIKGGGGDFNLPRASENTGPALSSGSRLCNGFPSRARHGHIC